MRNLEYRLIRYFKKFINKINFWPGKFFWNLLGSKKTEEIDWLGYLNSIYPDKGSSSLRNTFIKTTGKYDIQIIIPVYNVEKYIKQCIESILSQKTIASFIVYLINDGSTDKSPEIINQYKENPLIKIINQENKGVSIARNEGLNYLCGKYILFIDSDDFLPDNTALEKLFSKIKDNNYDIIQGGYNIINENNRILGKKVPLWGSITGYPWGKLYKAEIFHKIHFPEKYIFEDSINVLIIKDLYSNILTINDVVYSYRINNKGLVSSSPGNVQSLDSLYVTNQIIKDRRSLNLKNDLKFYETLLRQIQTNYSRVASLKDDKLNRCVFEISKKIINEFKEFKVDQKDLKILEYSLRKNNFRAYVFSCS